MSKKLKIVKKKKDTDYLAISARVRVLENRLLTRERMEQMIEAREDGEAAKILTDCGYGDITPLTHERVEEVLAQAQSDLMADLGKALGADNHVLPVFQIKYDYHNAKAILKGGAVGTDPARLLVSGGRFEPRTLLEKYRQGDMKEYPAPFVKAVEEAQELLATSHDPQLSDFLLDKSCYAEVLAEAERAGSPFLLEYVRNLVDGLNLRAAVRALRAGKGPDLLEKALIPGGTVPAERVAEAAKADGLASCFKDTPLREAAVLGAALLTGRGDMTAFEKACDDAVVRKVAEARRVPFGVEPVVGYLFARVSEATAIRTILSGRMAGLAKDTIRERLREAYV